MKMSAQRGFTLIEVMIVVAILGILAAVAYPSYQDYLDRGKVADGIATLADQRVRLEQFFQDNRNYGTGACGTDAGGTARLTFPVKSSKGLFNITCALQTVNGVANAGYTLTATTITGPAFTYTVNQANARTTTSFKGGSPTGSCATNWQTKKGESC